jgi:probable rRNA maturation factor
MALEIHNLQDLVEIDFDLLSRAAVLCAGCDDPELTLSIVDDAAIHKVNREHLGHDYPTDVISFDYSEEETGVGVWGEVILSAETALRVAGKPGRPALTEVVLYLVHGVLHLKGYDDQDPEKAKAMWREQSRIMNDLGFTGNFEP